MTADGYRVKYGKRLRGQPDMIFTRKKVVVFVDGCFWHGCPRCQKMPVDYESDFWQAKIKENRERDRRTTSALRKQGWRVIRVWEHDLRRDGDLERAARRVSRFIREAAD